MSFPVSVALPCQTLICPRFQTKRKSTVHFPSASIYYYAYWHSSRFSSCTPRPTSALAWQYDLLHLAPPDTRVKLCSKHTQGQTLFSYLFAWLRTARVLVFSRALGNCKLEAGEGNMWNMAAGEWEGWVGGVICLKCCGSINFPSSRPIDRLVLSIAKAENRGEKETFGGIMGEHSSGARRKVLFSSLWEVTGGGNGGVWGGGGEREGGGEIRRGQRMWQSLAKW